MDFRYPGSINGIVIFRLLWTDGMKQVWVGCAAVLAVGLLLAGCERNAAGTADAVPTLAFAPGGPVPLIPQPKAVQLHEGAGFTLNAATRVVVASGDQPAREAAQRLVEMLHESHGIALAVEEIASADAAPAAAIHFFTAPPPDERDGGPQADSTAEGYVLEVAPEGIQIRAADAAGAFYGAVSLWQLLGDTHTLPVAIPALRISDAPRFAWRGFMLDSARHLQRVEHVKRVLDQMARHKLNVLHWHLTDDQGWRLEIKRYPKLTDIGAWRVPAGKAGVDANGQPLRYGGFYTQDQAREIVEYARQRHITVMPEIELPGHAQATIAAYPELGAGGETPPVSPDWGVHAWLYNVEDSTFEFLENVLLEVMETFPSEYIHIGGDEADKYQWRNSPAVQAKRRELGLQDDDALQSWFIRRIGAFLSKHDRRLIGWDEILDGGALPPGATVMSWRGMDGAVEAARSGHDAVVSASDTLYLNRYQSSAADEPPGHNPETELVTLARVYGFEPVPAGLDAAQARHILGAQAHLWTEHVRTEARVEHMAFPRLSALAEVVWSPQSARDWNGFLPRLAVQMRRFARAGIRAADSAFAVYIHAEPQDGGARVALANQSGFGEVRYTLDGNEPATDSPRYTAPLDVALSATVTATAFFDGKPLARARRLSVDALALRTRDAEELAGCTESNFILRLEDDEPLASEPVDGERAVVPVNIVAPCWRWPRAALDGITRVRIAAVDLPYNFQFGGASMIETVPPPPARVNVQVRLDGCNSDPVAEAAVNPATGGIKQIDVPLPATTGTHDLCLTFSGDHRRTLWAIDRVQLLTAGDEP